jgi:hypothetical protein
VKRRLVQATSLLVFVGLLLVGVRYLSHIEWWTVQTVSVSGTELIEPDGVRQTASELLRGHYGGIIARSNALVYPQNQIADELRHTYPRIGKVSVQLTDLNTLSVRIEERKPFALLCPEGGSDRECRYVDREGVVYAKAPDFSGSVYVTFRAHATGTPVGGRYKPDSFPRIATFLRELGRIGLEPTHVIPRPQQDYWVRLEHGGHLRVSLREDVTETIRNLQTVLENDDLGLSAGPSGNTFRYIDLRFGDRVFYKYATGTAPSS